MAIKYEKNQIIEYSLYRRCKMFIGLVIFGPIIAGVTILICLIPDFLIVKLGGKGGG